MTRASLLHLLDHVTGISDAEIRELEQLAAAFPYCQTAHVLLAKAAHDQGSMLAGQRLRRAATYAADRELLRQLLEQPATPPTVTPAFETEAAATAAPVSESATEAVPAETDLFAVAAPELSDALLSAESTPQPALEAASAGETSESPADTPAPDAAAVDDEVAVGFAGEEAPTAALVQSEDSDAATELSELDAATPPEASGLTGEAVPTAPDEALAPEETAPEDASAAAPDAPATEQPVTAEVPATAAEAETEALVAAEVEPDALSEPAAKPDATLETAESAPATDSTPSDTEPQAESVADDEPAVANNAPAGEENEAEDLLPAVAPPIRPPVEAGISRFEFGLGASRLPEPSGYQLPDVDEAEDEDESAELPTLSSVAAPAVTAPFRADEDLGYALGAGSRLGYDLQRHDGFTLDLPLDSFFEPDALLLAHARAHQPKPKTSSLDLINRFLKDQPRIKTPGGVPLPASEQADLSVRSISAAPALASESLAKIMIRQGKPEKAIEIYERLMARQPEKKAYFAEQIQQLQQPPE